MYLVTGATGNVGSEVAAQLLANGDKVRIFTRDAARVAALAERAEIAIGDFKSPASFSEALGGVSAVFLMHQSADVDEFRGLVSAAKSAGRPRIVFLSSLLAANPQFTLGKLHLDKENTIAESGLEGRFVRPGGFMTNCYQWIPSIKSEGVVYNPLADGKFAPIAAEDIAAVAVKALKDDSFPKEPVELTGGELLDVPQQVKILSEVRGKPIKCVEITMESAIQNFIRAGIPTKLANAVAESYQSLRNGRGGLIRDTFRQITGRPPKSFEAWARDHASRFV